MCEKGEIAIFKTRKEEKTLYIPSAKKIKKKEKCLVTRDTSKCFRDGHYHRKYKKYIQKWTGKSG